MAPGLAELHLDVMRSGMALRAAATAVGGTLRRSYHGVVTRLDDRERLLLVAEQDGKLVGMAQVVFSGVGNAGHRTEIQRVAVGEAARGAGIGARLMRAVEETAVRRGVTLLWLTTHDDAAALRVLRGHRVHETRRDAELFSTARRNALARRLLLQGVHGVRGSR